MRELARRAAVKVLNAFGVNVSLMSNYYSPLPVVATLEKNKQRWTKPSELVGVRYDIESMKRRLRDLVSNYSDEYNALPGYDENSKKGYGPGFTVLDAMLLYLMIRDLKPKRFIEIGSGLSTYYCSLAAEKNAKDGNPLRMFCIDPYAPKPLENLPVEIIRKEAQDIELAFFEQLDAGDILFIDSTHVVKIDGEVPYLYLEVVPRLKKGVIVHVHDIPFPYNYPYPAEHYVLRKDWHVFWTEAMFLQAFLCYNETYRIIMSMPILRHSGEDFLASTIPNYEPFNHADPDNLKNHYCSIWIEKTK